MFHIAHPYVQHFVPLQRKKVLIEFRSLLYSRCYVEACETSVAAHIRDLAPGRHGSEKASHRSRAIGDTVSDLTSPIIETLTSRTNSYVLNN